MPPSAYALIALFAVISILAGAAAARVIGPRRWWAAVVPALAAFGVLYLVGHRWVLTVGPQVNVFGWDISLPFEIVAAFATAFVVAGLQRALAGLLQSQQRDTGGNGLA